MATVTITTNIDQVFKNMASSFELLKDKEYFLRPLAVETIPNMKERIHKDGHATDNTPIGTYSNGYMRVREENKRGKDTKIIVSPVQPYRSNEFECWLHKQICTDGSF